MSGRKLAAGILPNFNGKILMGLEDRNGSFKWMEFGGGVEPGETPEQAAVREFNEETANTFQLTLDDVKKAKHTIVYYNPKSNVEYTMFCLDLDYPFVDQGTFERNAIGKDHVEKIKWKYFDASAVINNVNGVLPDTPYEIYSTCQIRLKMLRDKLTGLPSQLDR